MRARALLASQPLPLLTPPLPHYNPKNPTKPPGVPLPSQRLVLAYRMDGSVATGDAEPCALGRMPPSFLDGVSRRVPPGTLLRFELGPGGFSLLQGRPVGADLRFLGVAGSRRGRADMLSKVLFQHLARTCPLTFAELEAAAAGMSRAGAPAGDAPSEPSDMLTEVSNGREGMEAEEEVGTTSASMHQG